MERENNMFFKANITSPNFNLGRLLGKSKEFGVVSLDSKMEGSMKSPKKYSNVESSIEADLKGKISRFDLLGYAISDIYFDGFYQDKKYDGTLISYDSNCQFNFTGLVDLTRSSPNFQTYISFKRFAIGKMAQYMPKVDSTFAAGFDKFIYFAQQNPKFALSFDSLEFNLNGEKLEGLNGFVGVDGLTISNHDKSVKGGRFRFTAINTASGLHKFILSASVMNATLTTNYPLNSVLDSLVEIGYRYFPNILPEREIVNKSFPKNINTAEEEKDQFFNFYAETYNSRELLGILFPTISLAPHAIVDIRFSTLEQHDSISVIIPAFAMRDKFIIRNLALAGNELAGGILNLQVTTDTLNIDNSNNNFSFKQIVLKTKTQDNQILYDLSWISPEAISSKSSMLLGSIDALNKNNIVIKTSKSAIYLKDFLWKFSDQNAVILGDHYIKFENLTVGNQDSYITLNGTLSQKEEDNLNVKVQNVDISLVNYFIKNLSFGGDVSASMDIKMVNNNRFIGGKLLASNFVFNDEKMGNLFLVTALGKKGSLGFSGGLFGREEPLNSNIVETYTIEQYRNEKIKLANLSGYYFSDKKLLHVKADIDTLHIGFLAPFLASFSNDISGVASGELSFISSPDSTYFDGVVHVKSANMGIAPLGTVYKIEKQDIIFDQKGFEFKNLVVKDKFNNVGYLNGYIHHQMFKDLDLNLQVKTDRLMVLNTSKDPSTSFYGDGFVSGTVTIQGGTDQLYFKGTNLTTLSGTKFFLPITSSESVSETGNIRFKTDSLQKQMIKTESEPGSIALAFDFIFDITKDAEIQVDLFSIGGTLRGRCTGPLKLTYNNETDLNLYGNLSMESGIFLLSLKDLLNAKFNI
ncbi:MAG: translocation/assembly module TamB domain-containing protein, partial [Bacteroidales bacterium]